MTIKTSRDLEERVLEYSPELKEKIRDDPRVKSELESIAGKTFKTYEPYLHKGKAGVVRKAGHGLGYLGDAVFWGAAIASTVNPILAPYMLTGLLLKKANAVAQAPEAGKSLNYMRKTGDYWGGIKSVGEKVISYFPGATIVDRGLENIAEKRAVKRVAYEVGKVTESGSKKWYSRIADKLKREGRYTDVKERRENIISPHFRKEDLKEAA